MGEHMNGLPRLGAHVAASLEQARQASAASTAADRVRARLADGEAPAPKAPVRVRRGAVLGALALAAALLFAITAWRSASERSRTLTFVVGGAGTGAGGGTESGVVGAFLAAPLTGDLPLAFSDGTQLHVGAGARARVAEVSHRGARVLVESGVVRANVVHRADTKWLVDAGPFEVKVTGTRFDVGWEPADQAIVVTLHEGSVVVTGCTLAEGQRVSAGQQLRASCKTGVSTVGTFAGSAAPEAASAASVAPVPTAATAAVDPSATSAAALPDAPPEASSRVRAVVPAPPADSVSAPAATSAAAPAAPPTTTTSATPVASGASAAPPATASELLARANTDRYAGRFDAATESLDTVRRRFRGTDAAATAAFELGRIAFDAQHDFATAGDWFDTYLRERPAGALAREALGRAIESRHRAGDGARAEQLAARYVAAYPDGPHSALARRLAEHAGARP